MMLGKTLKDLHLLKFISLSEFITEPPTYIQNTQQF